MGDTSGLPGGVSRDIAVLSDIHGNYIALETCIEYVLSQNIDTFIFLGDYVGDLAYPERTMKRIREISAKYECYFIRGNKEDYWIEYKHNGECGWKDGDSTTGTLLYNYSRLSQQDLEFFEGLPISRKIFEGIAPITICHGSPEKANQKLLPGHETALGILKNTDTPVILCGHTHIQDKIEGSGRKILNPGSVGVPFHSDKKAQFMILHETGGQWEEEFISLSYDVEKVIKELRTSGLDRHAPWWCAVTEHLLRDGTVSHGMVLSRAMALCGAETGSCVWPEIPEKYWEHAVAELGGR